MSKKLSLNDNPPRIYLDPVREPGLPGAGHIPAKYMIVGIAPSTARPLERRLEPFGSRSYELLQGIMGEYPSLYVTNLIKEPMVPGTKPKVHQVRRWERVLREEIALVHPQRILTLGKVPAAVLCPGFMDLRQDHGTFFWRPEEECYVVPTYHFAAAFRDRRLKPFLQNDLHRFFDLPDPQPVEYVLIERVEQIPVRQNKRFFFDLESTGVTLQDSITMMGFQWQDEPKVYVKRGPDRSWTKHLLEYLVKCKATVVGHNLPFDLMMVMKLLGTGTFPSWKALPTEDTLLLAHIAGEEPLSLKHLTSYRTDLPGSHSAGGFEDVGYQAEDVRSTQALWHYFKPSRQTFISQVVQELIVPVAQMRVRGVNFDHALLDKIETDTQAHILELDGSLQELNGSYFNPNSTMQVAEFLRRRAHLKLTEKTKAGNDSVAEKVLLSLLDLHPDNSALKMLLDYRASNKLESGFIHAYREFSQWDGLLHPNLKLWGTATGRLSCSDPNLQQVPREGPLKQIFVPRPGYEAICLCDLSQAELRVAALLSGDEEMAAALLSEDVHRRIASKIFHRPESEVTAQQRKWGKRITFGIIYGGTERGLAFTSGLEESLVAEIMGMYRQEFPGLARWLKHMEQVAKTEEYVTSLFGRSRSLKKARDSAEKKHAGEKKAYRQAVNTPIQGLASDVILVILRETVRQIHKMKLKTRPLFTVHDSMVLEVAQGESEAMPELIQCGFDSLHDTPLTSIPLFQTLPLVGDMALGCSWAKVESTSGYYDPQECWSFATNRREPRREKKK